MSQYRPTSWNSMLRQLAMIYVSDDGGPIRTIIGLRNTVWTGEYPSVKSGWSLPWESRLERDYMWVCETDTAVVWFLAQPLRIEIAVDDETYEYIPDVYEDRADGSVQITEIKKHREEIARDPRYELKLDLARYVCEGLGWTFKILEESDIHLPKVVFRNIRDMHDDGKLAVPLADMLAVRSHIEAVGGATTLGAAAKTLGGWQRGFALLKAMMVRRIVEIDLRLPFCFDNIVTLVPRTLASSRPGHRPLHRKIERPENPPAR
ncbi:TnsA endonuclease N-terminal domain-containing protein [Microvirga aerophila]|nr:TnsA endonuclease N-terminal domain-containing protein [Microvirga aerophila]